MLVFGLLGLALLSGVPAIMCFIPKSMPHPMNEDCITLHYRGLELLDNNGILGRQYTAVTSISSDDGGEWRGEFLEEGYNPFERYYPNGTLREEGACSFEIMGFEHCPFPDWHDLQWSRCYLPDGTLASKVVDGTGTQTLFTPEGVKVWELVLKDYQRVRYTLWYPNGQILGTSQYTIDGFEDGPFVNFHDNGKKRLEGAYKHGERIGKWTHYDRNGLVEWVDDYTRDSDPQEPE